jgi:integrase
MADGLPTGIDRTPQGRFRARYRDGEGKMHSKVFGKLADARTWRTTQLAAVHHGEHIDPRGRTTVGQYAEQYAKARRGLHRPSTRRRVNGLISVHIVGTPLGARPLNRVLPSEVQAWASSRAQVLAPSTLRNLVSLLRSIYASAADDRLVVRSPVPLRMSLPSTERARVVPLTATQVQALAAAMPDRNRAMVITQAGLGLRVGELLALTRADVDFLRREVHVRTQLAPGSRVRTAPKTPKSRRTIPLPTIVGEALAAHIAAWPPLADGSLFYTREAQPYRSDYYGLIFGKAVAKSGLPDGTTSHALRHAFASWLLAAGESVIAVAERLGHENASLVLKVYGHLVSGREEHTRRAIDAAFTASVTQGVTGVSKGSEILT